MEQYPAHIRSALTPERTVQTVEEHCRACAGYACEAAPAQLSQTAALAGLLHDMGKYTQKFRDYIIRASENQAVTPGSVNHTFAAVRFIMERWHTDPGQQVPQAAAELLAFAAGSHHGQFDGVSPAGEDGFRHRMEKRDIGYEEAKAGFLANCAGKAELDRRFAAAVGEMQRAVTRIRSLAATQTEAPFYTALLARLTLSAVIEADRRDTAQFMGQAPPNREGKLTEERRQTLLARVEEKLGSLDDSRPVDRARKAISDICRAAADRCPGIYRLTVPTGGGKTLAGLRYALAAAKGKKRIFFVIPLLSVLEQNAQVIHTYLEDDDAILEHHSNVVRQKTKDGELDENELLMANWNAPVVITTLVQLLDTLFAGKTSCIRRMNALADSVILIDEVQSVPTNMLTQFDLALNFLSGFCGATVVLCSATQPCLEQAAHRLRYAPQAELVPEDKQLWQVFARTRILDRLRGTGYTMEELAGFALSCAEEEKSLLVICNTKAETRQLYQLLSAGWTGRIFHLSNAMCMAHRKEMFRQIRNTLDRHLPVICVSSQLVEAGVDVSFGCVIRLLAGLDNIVQSAGRCNRSREDDRPHPVYVVNLNGESLSRLPDILRAQQAARSVLYRFQKEPAEFDDDLTGASAISAFYRTLYAQLPAGHQDYPLKQMKTTLYELLSANQSARAHCRPDGGYVLSQAFRTAGEQFHVFEENTQDVLVPYKEGEALIVELGSPQAEHDLSYRAQLVKKAADYSVALYQWQIEQLQRQQALYPLCGGAVLALQPWCYSLDCGFFPAGAEQPFLEVCDDL